jgi:predicted nucleotidyltransferase
LHPIRGEALVGDAAISLLAAPTRRLSVIDFNLQTSILKVYPQARPKGVASPEAALISPLAVSVHSGSLCFMDRERAIATLRDYEPELKAIGVVSASLFGSVARGDAGPESDVDVAVQLSDGFCGGGFDSFWQLQQLEQRLARLLGCKVDVVAEPVRKKRFQDEIDRDRALAF